MSANKLLQAAAGNAGEAVYVEDVFSTYLYDGNDSATSVTNGLDLSGEGGLVWIKRRNGTNYHSLFDSETSSGGRYYLTSNASNALLDTGTTSVPFTSTGFTANGSSFQWNNSAGEYTSFSFREQAGFFSVVTYTGTGTGTGDRTISHGLGSTPGVIILKDLDAANNWIVYHRDLTDSGSYKKNLVLNSTTDESGNNFWVNAGITDTTFRFNDQFVNMNVSGRNYVAYLFAHDDQSFGDDSDESIIKCGSYTGGTDGTTFVDLGFEPQWLLLKRVNSSSNWAMLDIMRGLSAAQGTPPHRIEANSTSAENTVGLNGAYVSSTGFYPWGNSGGDWNASGATYIYIAIRRPMKTPEAGTDFFKPVTRTGSGAVTTTGVGFTPDAFYNFDRTYGGSNGLFDRLRGRGILQTMSTAVENATSPAGYDLDGFDTMDGVELGAAYNINMTGSGRNFVDYYFKRATAAFDVVGYKGNNTYGRNVAHNLAVVPELMIVKCRDLTEGFAVYHKDIGNNYVVNLNTTGNAQPTTLWHNTTPTSSVFTLTADNQVNSDGTPYGGSVRFYIAYLFATLAGVSKVGSYSGTGSNVDVDCGFSSGARFVLIKRTDSTGDWYVYDSARGIVAGNDPYVLANSSAAEVTGTDYIDPLSSGFTVTSSAPAALNTSGGTYIFLAIA